MSASDVDSVVRDLVTTQADAVKGNNIVIYSGTHGTSTGNLVNTGAGAFVGEDQATANAVTADPGAPEGTSISVVDVNTLSKDQLVNIMDNTTDHVRILAWCYSARSWVNSTSIKSNWWPAPDNL